MLGERVASRPARAGFPWVSRASVVALGAAHWPVLLALALVALAGVPSLNFMYGPDQALFAYVGRRLLHGQTLYVDLWDVKPPGVFWMYSLVSWAPGGARAVRAFDLAYTLLTVTAIYALGRLFWDRATGAIAGLLYGVVYVTGSGYWNMAQPDGFMVLPVVLGVLAWEGGPRLDAVRSAFVAGLLFGFAFQFRSIVVLLSAALVVWELVTADRRSALRRIAWLAAGLVAVQVVTLAYLAVGGAVPYYLYAQLRFARHYAALGGPYAYDGFTFDNYLTGLRGGLMWFVNSRLLITAPAFAALFLGGALLGDRRVRLLGLLLAAAMVCVAVQAKFFVYHWHIVLPFLALLAAWTATRAWQALRARLPWRPAAIAAAGGVAGLLLFTPQVTDGGLGEWRDLVRYLREPAYRPVYFDRFGLRGHGTYSFRASEEVADYVRVRTKPGDTVFVWGYDPNFYIMSGRDSASRFLSLLPLMPTFTPESWKQEFVRDLETRRPAAILIQQGENARWITGRPDDSAEWVPQFTEFNDVLTREYRLDQRIEDYYIYFRR